MEASPLPQLCRQDTTRPCDFARLPDDCVRHLMQLTDAESLPCSRAVCHAFRAAARPRAGEQVLPTSLIRAGPSVAAWAWAQLAFRAAAGCGAARVCVELGNVELLERVLDHRNTDLWIGAGEAGHAHVLQWLPDRAARFSPGDATQLNLRGNPDEIMQHLASALRADTTLRSLDFSFSHINSGGAEHLASALAVNTTVTRLNLGFNTVGSVGLLHLAGALRANATLTSLDLRSNTLGDASAYHLASALAANATLTSLNVMGIYLTVEGAHALIAVADSKPNQIKSLCGIGVEMNYILFYDSSLGAVDAVLLAFELRINATVTRLNLCHNNIGDVGAQHIAEALKVNATVTKLDLGCNHIGAVGAQHITEALKVNATVELLDFRGNDLVDSSKALLREAWRHGSGLLIL